MRRSVGIWTLLLGVSAALGAVAIACVDEPHHRTPPGKVFGGGSACAAKPGEFPEPDCDNSSKQCTPTPGCVIDEARCGSTATCMPAANNAGKTVLDFRMRRLNVADPEALASPFIQDTVINSGIDLDEPACGESGKGLFTWLLEVDTAANTLRTGGAPPSKDPIGEGFCFATFELNGTKVEPETSKIELSSDGTFRTLDPLRINIPIFLSEELSSAILLPIQDARLERVTLSSDGKGTNCIGAFNAAALDPSCTEDRDLCSKWTTAGSLAGFMTLEDADGVKIHDLNNKSLCAFLAGQQGLVCDRDAQGKITFLGDYCSLDKTAGSCQDSVWLAATFAASAVKVFDGHGIVDGCSGASAATPTPDAGSDAAISDAATDSD
jgi:hypothetical protein